MTNTPLRDQKRFTEAVIWSLARIVQEITNKLIWPFGKADDKFADRILREYREMVRDDE